MASFKQFVFSFLLIGVGLTSIWNGCLMLFDDRKLNKTLLSSLLFISGVIFTCDGLIILGVDTAENIKSIALTSLFFTELISIKLIGDYRYERELNTQKREGETRE